MNKSSWDEFFIRMAELASSKSKDRSTKVGAVIVGDGHAVLSIGYNGFTRGVDDNVESRHERPAKYFYTEHAERNAIYNAARNGIKTSGTVMYLNAGANLCADCARAVIQAGISEVVGRDIPFEGKGDWAESFRVGREMLEEAGVIITLLDSDFVRMPRRMSARDLR